MKKSKWKRILLIIAVVWAVFLTTDITTTIMQIHPIFTVKIYEVLDGGSACYAGMFYTVHKQINNAFTPNYYYTYTIYPWFCEELFDI